MQLLIEELEIPIRENGLLDWHILPPDYPDLGNDRIFEGSEVSFRYPFCDREGRKFPDRSLNRKYVDTLDPDAPAISCGNNTYGHPGQLVLDRLLGTGDVYLTNLCDTTRNYGAAVIVNGDIILQSIDGVNYTIDGVGYVASDPSGSTPTPTATTPPTPTPTAPPSPTDHVGDLDGSTSPANGGKWNATITITVEDTDHNPVANATVSGSWSAGANGSDSCVTNASGQCTITKNNINKNSSSATFTVTDVTHTAYTYSSADNHDPDGDSDGTVITVNKP